MEKHKHQEYRDSLATDLNEIRKAENELPDLARARAQGYLQAAKQSNEYKNAHKKHLDDVQEHLAEGKLEREPDYPRIEINGEIFEWGPILEEYGMSANQAKVKIEGLNEKYGRIKNKGEWRLPTVKELKLTIEQGNSEIGTWGGGMWLSGQSEGKYCFGVSSDGKILDLCTKDALLNGVRVIRNDIENTQKLETSSNVRVQNQEDKEREFDEWLEPWLNYHYMIAPYGLLERLKD